MAVIKLHDDIYLAAGSATKDAQFKRVGEKNSAVCTFSIAAGKRKDTTTIFVDLKAWRRLAEYAADIQKGDAVCAIGKMESREYNGKTYNTVVADWLNFVGKADSERDSGPKIDSGYSDSAASNGGFTELGEDDGDLPF